MLNLPLMNCLTTSSLLASSSSAVPCAMMWPSFKTINLSPILRALGTLCVTTTIVVLFDDLRSIRSLSISRVVIGSRPLLGSSTSRMEGFSARARARSDSLSHAPREIEWHFVEFGFQSDSGQPFTHGICNLFLRHPGMAAKGKCDIVGNR